MGFLRLITGAVTTGGARALVVTSGSAAAPTLTLTPAAAAAPTVTEIVPTDAGVHDYLLQKGFRLYAAEAGALEAGQTYAATATMPGASPETRRFRVPGDASTATELSGVVASCYYDGFSRGPAYRRALQRPCRFTHPLFKVLAGDNVYVDIPLNAVGCC